MRSVISRSLLPLGVNHHLTNYMQKIKSAPADISPLCSTHYFPLIFYSSTLLILLSFFFPLRLKRSDYFSRGSTNRTPLARCYVSCRKSKRWKGLTTYEKKKKKTNKENNIAVIYINRSVKDETRNLHRFRVDAREDCRGFFSFGRSSRDNDSSSRQAARSSRNVSSLLRGQSYLCNSYRRAQLRYLTCISIRV